MKSPQPTEYELPKGLQCNRESRTGKGENAIGGIRRSTGYSIYGLLPNCQC